jgi:hypothetical protein
VFFTSAVPASVSPHLQVVRELLDRFDAHLKAEEFFSVIANMRGRSPEEVATTLLQMPGLQGLQVRSGEARAGEPRDEV